MPDRSTLLLPVFQDASPLSGHPTRMPIDPLGISDEDLFQRFKATSQDKDFEELVRRLKDLAYRSAIAIGGQEAFAEEVAQEAFLRLARSETKFMDQGPGSFRGWFFRLVVNIARGRQRAERRLMGREKIKRAENPVEFEPSHPEGTEKQEVLTALQVALTSLSEDFRTPIILHYLEGQSQLDVGKMIGLSQSQVSRRLAEGLEAIRQKLSSMGVAMPAVALTTLLTDPTFLQAPASLLHSLKGALHQPGPALEPLEHVSRRVVAHKTKFAAGLWITAGVAAAVILCCSYVFWNRDTNPKTPVATPVAAAQPVTPPTPAPVSLTSKAWNFNAPEQAQEFKVLTGSWHFVPNGGSDGSGCMETEDDFLSILIPVNQGSLPLEITYQVKAIPPAIKYGNHMAMVGFNDEGIRWGASFQNIGYVRMENVNQPSWVDNRMYVTDRFTDQWINGQRSTFVLYALRENAQPVLVCRGKHRIDNLSIRPIKKEECPDTSAFFAAMDRIPADKRTGKVVAPELKSMRPPNPVIIDFLRVPPEETPKIEKR